MWNHLWAKGGKLGHCRAALADVLAELDRGGFRYEVKRESLCNHIFILG